ncbi:MAG: ferredoxin--NADP reductase [Bacteroidetes bacterium]|nr:ferredoxin--NADP reductase [Bacteroidota bacterium]
MIKAYILTLSNVVRETPDAVTLKFEQPSFGRIWYYPGQFLTIRLKVEGKYYFRSYSISSVPQLDSFVGITIKRVLGGKVSNFIIDHLKPGQQIEVLNPRGKFFLEPGLKKQRNIVFFAGGSGISPIMSILRAILFQEPLSKITLIFANRRESDIIFKDKLSELAGKFPDRLQISHFLSQPELTTRIPHHKGRLNSQAVEAILLERNVLENAQFFLCGPDSMMEMVRNTLSGLDIENSDIFQEEFTRDVKEENSLNKKLGPAQKVEIELGQETYHVMVPPGVTVLDAALSQDLAIPYSCRRGTCATCMGKLISGKVDTVDESSLLEFEKEQGFVLVCQAHPVAKNTRIRMGYHYENE